MYSKDPKQTCFVHAIKHWIVEKKITIKLCFREIYFFINLNIYDAKEKLRKIEKLNLVFVIHFCFANYGTYITVMNEHI